MPAEAAQTPDCEARRTASLSFFGFFYRLLKSLSREITTFNSYSVLFDALILTFRYPRLAVRNVRESDVKAVGYTIPPDRQLWGQPRVSIMEETTDWDTDRCLAALKKVHDLEHQVRLFV